MPASLTSGHTPAPRIGLAIADPAIILRTGRALSLAAFHYSRHEISARTTGLGSRRPLVAAPQYSHLGLDVRTTSVGSLVLGRLCAVGTSLF